MIQHLPKEIFSGSWAGGHCQGIAVDTKHECIYYSFTTMLVKTDLQGNLIGSVTGLLGHLGCIDFCDRDGRLYGSLEYKNDSIGKGILKNAGSDAKLEDGFYIAIFDVERIDRPGMDACTDGVMTAVFLPQVLDDYRSGKYGCSGIDGTTFGPIPGDSSGKEYLFVAYGIYGDTSRDDNDYQVLLCYDTENWRALEKPLAQNAMHRSGPAKPDHLFYVYTGNTTYGVQNLEYDAFTRQWFMAVYPGKKSDFANPSLFALDAAKAPELRPLKGLNQFGLCLSLSGNGLEGWTFPWGATGLCALGDGHYLISHEQSGPAGDASEVFLYRYDGKTPFEEV